MSLFYANPNGDGTYEVINQVEAQKKGWGQYDLEVGYDYKFYLVGNAPAKPQELIKEERIAELRALISSTDHIIIEMAENALRNGGNLVMPTGEVGESYTTVLAQRDTWRAEIEELSN